MSSNMRIPTKCITCGNVFIAKTTVTKYCSTKCIKTEIRRKKREAMTGSPDLLYHNKCTVCNTPFTSKTSIANFCSEKCFNRDRKKKAREKKVAAAIARNNSDIPLLPIGNNHPAPASVTITTTPKEFYSIKEFAKILGVHERTIMNHVWKNQLPHCRIGRRILINKEEAVQFFKKG
jgi:excisionase family DNA binding protein